MELPCGSESLPTHTTIWTISAGRSRCSISGNARWSLFAGDLVSTFAIPPLRRLNCPLIACFGDNEGNKLGIRGGMQIVGQIGEPPLGFRTPDGTRFLLTHQRELLRAPGIDEDLIVGADVIVYAHTHRPSIRRDQLGRMWINPGETSGWTYGDPTVVVLDTAGGATDLVHLASLPPATVPGTQ